MCAGVLCAEAAADSGHHAPALGAGMFASSDNEGFVTRRITAEYLFGSASGAVRPGIRVRQHAFALGDWSRNARQLLLSATRNAGAAGIGWQAEAGILEQGGRRLLSADATLHAAIAPATSVEALLNRDYVETAAALDQGIHVTFAGASIEHAVNPHVTGIALLGRQNFSDGNARNHGRLRLIYQPSLDLGLTLQLRYRYFDSNAETRRAYFNPEHYRESMALAGWRKRGSGWTGTLLAGLGRQHVGEDTSTPTSLLEASLEMSPGSGQTLSFRAGYNQSASFGGPDYRYRQAQAVWSARF